MLKLLLQKYLDSIRLNEKKSSTKDGMLILNIQTLSCVLVQYIFGSDGISQLQTHRHFHTENYNANRNAGRKIVHSNTDTEYNNKCGSCKHATMRMRNFRLHINLL